MEFPILHTGLCGDFETIIKLMKEKCPDCRHYSNEHSFTMLEESEINRMFNNDFAKIRVFKGIRISHEILPILTEFFNNGSNSQSQRRIVNTASYLTPYDYEEDEFMDYDMERFAAVFNANDSSEVVQNVFRASFDMFNQDEDQIEKIKWSGAANIYYLESFQSLFQLPTIGASEKLSEKEINREIDNLIDQGRIIPVYERTVDNDNPLVETAYWRRYFKASHTISSDLD